MIHFEKGLSDFCKFGGPFLQDEMGGGDFLRDFAGVFPQMGEGSEFSVGFSGVASLFLVDKGVI